MVKRHYFCLNFVEIFLVVTLIAYVVVRSPDD